MANNRVTFGSKLGVVLATVGCAVGLGSVWRFPYMLGANGGAAFLLVYILFMIFLGIPVMITEFFIGRHSRSNTVGSFKKMAPGTKWCWIGYNGILAAFLILSYYSVVSGWTLEYVWQTLSGRLYGQPDIDYTADFQDFASNVFRPIFWMGAFIGLTHFVIVSGVEKGIERASKIMMPLLFLILLIMCVRSVTLPNAEAGLLFLFKPDFSKLTSSVVLSALGQAFFSLSLGMGCLITYSSYFGKDTNMQATAWQVTIINTLVAVLAGIMIFPAVFSFGITPSAGAELVFITLPNVFGQLPLPVFLLICHQDNLYLSHPFRIFKKCFKFLFQNTFLHIFTLLSCRIFLLLLTGYRHRRYCQKYSDEQQDSPFCRIHFGQSGYKFCFL